MRFIRPAVAAALLVSTFASTPAFAAGSAAFGLIRLSQLNLTVLNDWQFNGGGEVEGKVWVGRDALGGSQTQIGFGASNGQSTTASNFATVTVGRNAQTGFQIKNSVGGAYGAYIVGNTGNEINVQDTVATVKVGGSVGNGGVKMTYGSSLSVVGNYNGQNNLDLSDNNSVWIGGNANSRIQGGNSGISLKVNGNVKSIDLAGGSSTGQIGGSLGAGGDYSATKSNLTVLGSITNLQMNDNGLTVKSGGSISGISISNASNVYAAGSIGVQSNNGGPGAIHANCGAAYAACAPTAAPTAPGMPVVGGISVPAMTADFAALSTSLKNLSTTNHLGTLSVTNGGQAYTFSSNNMNSTGYTVFNVNETIFNKNEFAYNFANTTTPVIINVKNSGACTNTLTCSYSMNSNFTGNVGTYNQNVIWNFVDASNIVLNRQFQGTVLAYLADLQSNVIEGSVVVKNFTQTNEIHLGTFKRSDANSLALTGVIPEPANWALMIAGFGLIGGTMRRRRAFAVAA